MSDEPTLLADGARIDVAGQPLVARLTWRSEGERIALFGDWSALFRLLAREAELSAGTLLVAGAPADVAVQRGIAGVLRADVLLPGAWSAEELLASSAELFGLERKPARRLAFQTLDRLGLGALAARRLSQLERTERRLLLIAHAVLTDPRVVCLELPLTGLDTPGEAAVSALIERASAGRRLLVALGDQAYTAAARQVAATCSEHLRLTAGVVAKDAAESEVKRVTATVCRNHYAFADALARRGLAAHPTHEAGLLNALTSPLAGPCWRYLVELPGGSTAAILDAALETDAGLVELSPQA